LSQDAESRIRFTASGLIRLHVHLTRFCGAIAPFLPVESTPDVEPR
jgi:hypothetical protein